MDVFNVENIEPAKDDFATFKNFWVPTGLPFTVKIKSHSISAELLPRTPISASMMMVENMLLGRLKLFTAELLTAKGPTRFSSVFRRKTLRTICSLYLIVPLSSIVQPSPRCLTVVILLHLYDCCHNIISSSKSSSCLDSNRG